jgi:hypothetical protein
MRPWQTGDAGQGKKAGTITLAGRVCRGTHCGQFVGSQVLRFVNQNRQLDSLLGGSVREVTHELAQVGF